MTGYVVKLRPDPGMSSNIFYWHRYNRSIFALNVPLRIYSKSDSGFVSVLCVLVLRYLLTMVDIGGVYVFHVCFDWFMVLGFVLMYVV